MSVGRNDSRSSGYVMHLRVRKFDLCCSPAALLTSCTPTTRALSRRWLGALLRTQDYVMRGTPMLGETVKGLVHDYAGQRRDPHVLA